VVWLGGSELPRSPSALGDLLGAPLGNAVVDLSHLDLADRVRWLAGLPEFVSTQRSEHGSPHWVVIDEAHLVASSPDLIRQLFRSGFSQCCFVTFLADLLHVSLIEHLDAVALVGGDAGARSFLCHVAAVNHVDEGELARALVDTAPGSAVVLGSLDRGSIVHCHVGGRHTGHVRHWHKYATERMPRFAFRFRRSGGEETGETAASLAELHDGLATVESTVLVHHATHGDLSRWIRDVMGDQVLARTLERAEHGLRTGTPVEAVRLQLVDAINDRYRTD
jgi:hypothetical protein